MTGKEIVDQSRSSDCGHDETHCAVVCETCCANAIDAALAAERERCAKIAERYEPDQRASYVNYASQEIRALEVT
jgi:hypothetical protein